MPLFLLLYLSCRLWRYLWSARPSWRPRSQSARRHQCRRPGSQTQQHNTQTSEYWLWLRNIVWRRCPQVNSLFCFFDLWKKKLYKKKKKNRFAWLREANLSELLLMKWGRKGQETRKGKIARNVIWQLIHRGGVKGDQVEKLKLGWFRQTLCN